MGEQLFLVEAKPGDEGRDEIVLTVSDLHVEEQEEKPACVQGHVEKASATKNPKKTKGRPARAAEEIVPTRGLPLLFRGTRGWLKFYVVDL